MQKKEHITEDSNGVFKWFVYAYLQRKCKHDGHISIVLAQGFWEILIHGGQIALACRKEANGHRSEWKNKIAYMENQGPERSEVGHGLRGLFEGMLPLIPMVL